jgi:hypothetical protein
VQPADVPTPAAVAARPHDDRGYPVLAITPWHDGLPDFAVTSPARILVCAVERRCSICGLGLARGPVWRVVGAEEAAAVLAGPHAFENVASTVEPPGHRLCMLYAAVVCPWLAHPQGRRGAAVSAPGLELDRGAARGAVGDLGGAVVGFEGYEFTADERVELRYRGVVEVLPHLHGEEHLALLRAETAHEPEPDQACPPWLLDDEEAAVERARRYL